MYNVICYNIIYNFRMVERIQMPCIEELLNKLWYIPVIEYYATIEKNEKDLYGML